MMIFEPSVIIELLALAVVSASVCRLKDLHITVHKLIWVAFYFFGLFCGSAAALYDTVTGGPRWSTLLLLLGAALFLWASRHSWHDGAPRFLQK